MCDGFIQFCVASDFGNVLVHRSVILTYTL